MERTPRAGVPCLGRCSIARFRILSIDGGGIRGVFPATYLADIESRLSTPLAAHFDLVVGTSTGGIIAIGLGLGVPASTLAALYRERGREVFGRPANALLRFIRPKYGNEGLVRCLRETFGDAQLGASACRLCVPSFDAVSGKAKVFKTSHRPEFVTDWKLPAWKVAAATAAAPTYFPAFSVCEGDAKLDGGIWANNPALVGLTEAFKLGTAPADIDLLSIGTGEVAFEMPSHAAARAGVLAWTPLPRLLGGRVSVIELLGAAQAQAIQNVVQYLGPAHVERVNVALPPNRYRLDDVAASIDLVEKARQAAQESGQRVIARFFNARAAEWTPYCGSDLRKRL